jgi:hypothetical protein
MLWISNFLMIFLLAFAQVDDVIFADANTPFDPVTNNDDEYLPVKREACTEKSSSRESLSQGKLIPDGVLSNCCFASESFLPESRRLHSSGYSSLYVFMSLRR